MLGLRRQPSAARAAGIDDDIGIEQHGCSIVRRHRAITPYFPLPGRRVGDFSERISLAQVGQRPAATLEPFIGCGIHLIDEQRHLHPPGTHPSRQRTGQRHRTVLGNVSLCLKRSHRPPLPHRPTPVNPTPDLRPPTPVSCLLQLLTKRRPRPQALLRAASLSRIGGVRPRIFFVSRMMRRREGQSIRLSKPAAAR